MSKKEFDLGLFIDTVMKSNKSVYSESEQQNNARILKLYRDIMGSKEIAEEWLANVTEQDLEWILDLVMYWPSFEMDMEPEDWNHIGVQSFMIEGIIESLRQMPSVRRKGVAFF
jgi:hypothetical protein